MDLKNISIEQMIAETNNYRNGLCKKVSLTFLNSVLFLLFKLRKLEKSSLFFFDPIEYELVSVQRKQIPKNYVLVECYESKEEFIIVGHPCATISHDCGSMGCFSGKHVIYRFTK